jgi:hypothetical protein
LRIRLSWSPVGLATAYGLQISTDPNFTVLDVNEIYRTDARYTFGAANANTPYYWRVSTLNDGGISDWATGSFTTVPPMIRVTAPNGGESFKRGTTVYIRWQDNLDEDVAIELVKGGVPMETLDTVASNGAVAWEVSLTLQPGDDYAVRIKSTTDKALADASDANFTVR